MTDMATREVVLLGGGAHARVLQETLGLLGVPVVGFVAPGGAWPVDSLVWLGSDDVLDGLDRRGTMLVNGVGSTRAAGLRATVFEAARALGFDFATVVDPSAVVRASARLGRGVQVLAGAIVNTDAVVGEDSIVNSGAIIEHHCRLGSHVHVSPGAVLGGGVIVGDRSHVGLGARVLQGVSIGSDCTIGAGAVVTHDVPDNSIAVGVPAAHRPAK